MKYIRELDSRSAQDLIEKIEAMESNPCRNERKIKGAKCLAPERITPLYAFLVNEEGDVDIGIPDSNHNWAETEIGKHLAELPENERKSIHNSRYDDARPRPSINSQQKRRNK